jgi:ribosomal protein L37E
MAVVEFGRGYQIGMDRRSITCEVCGTTSYNLNDVARLYCAKCDEFHEDRALAYKLELEMYAR